MAGGKSEAYSTAILNVLLGVQLPAAPATLYIALLHTNPTDDTMSGAVESSYTNYARVAIASSSAGWNTPGPGTGNVQQTSNKNVATFPTAGATGDTGINGWALMADNTSTVTTASKVYYWAPITGAPKVINASDPVSMAAGALVITES